MVCVKTTRVESTPRPCALSKSYLPVLERREIAVAVQLQEAARFAMIF